MRIAKIHLSLFKEDEWLEVGIERKKKAKVFSFFFFLLKRKYCSIIKQIINYSVFNSFNYQVVLSFA